GPFDEQERTGDVVDGLELGGVEAAAGLLGSGGHAVTSESICSMSCRPRSSTSVSGHRRIRPMVATTSALEIDSMGTPSATPDTAASWKWRITRSIHACFS